MNKSKDNTFGGIKSSRDGLVWRSQTAFFFCMGAGKRVWYINDTISVQSLGWVVIGVSSNFLNELTYWACAVYEWLNVWCHAPFTVTCEVERWWSFSRCWDWIFLKGDLFWKGRRNKQQNELALFLFVITIQHLVIPVAAYESRNHFYPLR